MAGRPCFSCIPLAVWIVAIASSCAAKTTEKVLYSFSGGKDGAQPIAGLTRVGDTFFGTTALGGAQGHGTVFSVTSGGVFTVLYSFAGGTDAEDVAAPLLYADGELYGTSTGGGSGNGANCVGSEDGCGTVFKVTLAGEESVLYSFKSGKNANDGYQPQDTLVELGGVFYGTTLLNGASTGGTVFSLTKSGKEKILHYFSFSDGESPYSGLTVLNGVLYGTTCDGGIYGDGSYGGVAYSITTDGTYTLLHSFGAQGDGGCPFNTPLRVVGNTFYGATIHAGAANKGVIFGLAPDGTETLVESFTTGAAVPLGNLVMKGSFLYGIAGEGGFKNEGAVFKAPIAGGKITPLYEFGKTAGDGKYTQGGLIQVGNSFYGVTESGGEYNKGTIFKITQ